MGAAAAAVASGDLAPPGAKGSKKKLILVAAVVLLAVVLAGLWFSGILPGVLSRTHSPAKAEQKADAGQVAATPQAPVFVELPEIISNLDTSGHRATFAKLKARVELAKPEDQAAFTAAQPRVVDLFVTYLRETRPEELQERAGADRLREQLITRANIAVAPAQILDILFSELLVQ